ncbi:helix-turn-helix domain-containing protein [Streptomyces sp. JNUCC 64]
MADGERRGEHPARELGSALRALQRRSGRTLRSLEAEVSTSDSSLSRYLRGSTVPPWATVRELCRALGADPAPYRELWEAADRAQPRPPVEPPVVVAPERGRRWPRRPGWTRGRWGWAGAGLVVGAVLGSVVTGVVVRTAATGEAARAAAGRAPQSADGGRLFVNRATGACLDDSLDQGLRSFTCNALPYQRWTVRTSPDGTSQLRSHATGACLTVSGTDPGAAACGASTAQKWRIKVVDDGAAWEVRNRATGTCLHDGPDGLRVRPCDRTARQKWA